MSSISIQVYATSKTNVQFYTITLVPTSGPSITALSRYSELRAFRKTISAKRGFPPKLYFPTADDLEKRRQQISKWLTTILSTHAKELEAFMKSQRAKYEEDDIEDMFTPATSTTLYLSSSDNVRRYDPVHKNWPVVVAFHLFHVHLDMDSHLYATGNCIWAPSFRGIQCYYPPWHKPITIPYPENFLKSIAPLHGIAQDQQLILYHHKQLITLDVPTGLWTAFPPVPSANPPRDNLWWPGFVAAGKHLHVIYPAEHFVFNTATKAWKSAAPPPVTTGTYYPGWVYAKKKVYMMVCSANTVLDSFCYDVRLDEWSQCAAFPAIHKVPTVVNIAYDNNNCIYVRTASQVFCYDIGDNAWEEKKDMALADRSMAIFYSNNFEDSEPVTKEQALFKSRIEKLLVKAKLSGPGPWGELYQKTQITQVERDLMVSYESASLSERIAIFKRMGANPSSNVFQQLWEEEPSSDAKERIEWLIFQALQEEPSLGDYLCNICPKFKKTEKGTYTWAPPGSSRDDEPFSRKGTRKGRRTPSQDNDADEDEEDAVEASEEGAELKAVVEKGERIMKQLKDKKVAVPEEFICPLTHVIMTEPVATVDGHAFERTAIEGWFSKGNDKSPVTHTKLDDVRVVPNLPLRKLIKTFLETHQVETG